MLALSQSLTFFYQTASFFIEIFSTVIILFSTYSLVKLSEINFFLIFLLTIAVTINVSILLGEIFMKHFKLIRTSIFIDTLLVITFLTFFISSKMNEYSHFIINLFDQLRLIPNTKYRGLVNGIEQLIGCCRLPNLVSK